MEKEQRPSQEQRQKGFIFAMIKGIIRGVFSNEPPKITPLTPEQATALGLDEVDREFRKSIGIEE